MDYQKLLEAWAEQQGFQSWAQDHAAVLRNLAKWLNQNAAQHRVPPDGGYVSPDKKFVIGGCCQDGFILPPPAANVNRSAALAEKEIVVGISRMLYDAKFEIRASTNSPSSEEYIIEILDELEGIWVKQAAEYSVHLAALRRWLAVSLLFNVVLLVVFVAIIGGK